MKVTLVYASAPRVVHEATLALEEGACTVGDALQRAGWLQRFPEIQREALSVGVWGRAATLDRGLSDGDRVEVVRGLRVDPKVARRERFVGQGARRTGLFANRRPGSKAGY